MRVTVLCFGMLKDLVGAERHEVVVAEGETAGGLVRLFAERTSNPGEIWKTLAVAVNREYAEAGRVLREGDEVALLPPVSGGWA